VTGNQGNHSNLNYRNKVIKWFDYRSIIKLYQNQIKVILITLDYLINLWTHCTESKLPLSYIREIPSIRDLGIAHLKFSQLLFNENNNVKLISLLNARSPRLGDFANIWGQLFYVKARLPATARQRSRIAKIIASPLMYSTLPSCNHMKLHFCLNSVFLDLYPPHLTTFKMAIPSLALLIVFIPTPIKTFAYLARKPHSSRMLYQVWD
jgi:hypothetical protein